jgi:predicted HicB family RNase H-like nuclease
MPVKRPKTAVVQVRLDPEEKALAEAAAEAEGRSLANYIRRLITADVAKRGIKLPK